MAGVIFWRGRGFVWAGLLRRVVLPDNHDFGWFVELSSALGLVPEDDCLVKGGLVDLALLCLDKRVLLGV